MRGSATTSGRRATLLAAGVILGAAACLVSDQDLPCRRDCQCPGGQVCVDKVCTPQGSAPDRPAAGEPDGDCLAGNSCAANLACAQDACGDWRCHPTCSAGAVTSNCPEDQGCEPTGASGDGADAGAGLQPGVCLP